MDQGKYRGGVCCEYKVRQDGGEDKVGKKQEYGEIYGGRCPGYFREEDFLVEFKYGYNK